jgi:hypothetical protein
MVYFERLNLKVLWYYIFSYLINLYRLAEVQAILLEQRQAFKIYFLEPSLLYNLYLLAFLFFFYQVFFAIILQHLFFYLLMFEEILLKQRMYFLKFNCFKLYKQTLVSLSWMEFICCNQYLVFDAFF